MKHIITLALIALLVTYASGAASDITIETVGQWIQDINLGTSEYLDNAMDGSSSCVTATKSVNDEVASTFTGNFNTATFTAAMNKVMIKFSYQQRVCKFSEMMIQFDELLNIPSLVVGVMTRLFAESVQLALNIFVFGNEDTLSTVMGESIAY